MNSITKRIHVALLVLACALTCFSQEEHQGKVKAKSEVKDMPNLSGDWILDRTKSDFGKDTGPLSKAETKLRIVHKEPEVRIIWSFDLNGQGLALLSIIYTDGRGERTPSLFQISDMLSSLKLGESGGGGPGPSVESKTEWRANKLVTQLVDHRSISGKNVDFDITDEWILSSDKKSLMQITKLVPRQNTTGKNDIFPTGTQELKRIYNHIEGK